MKFLPDVNCVWFLFIYNVSLDRCCVVECRGAAVDVKNKKGNTPLWLACNGMYCLLGFMQFL